MKACLPGKYVPTARLLLLAAILAATPGYRFRCYFACVDQTGLQNDYVEQRDRCREYAQLKIDMAMREAGENGDKSRKSNLVSLFSQCMANNGWNVPDGKEKGVANPMPGPGIPPTGIATAAAPVAAQPVATQDQVNQQKKRDQMVLSRNAECAFARHSATVSANAAARAAACDTECANALKAAPGAPRPAACAPESASKYSKGAEE